MVIDFDKLDKRKSYVILEYGTSLVSKLISKFTKDYCPEVKTRPSHVIGLKYNGYCWQIYESHLKPTSDPKIGSGVRTYSQYFFEGEFPQIVASTGKVYPLSLELKELTHLLGEPYGLGDILSLGKQYFRHNNGSQKDRVGYICSEYIATACKKIVSYFNLPPHCITPAHFLKYFLDNGIEPLN